MKTVFGIKTVVVAVAGEYAVFVIAVSEDLNSHAEKLGQMKYLGHAWLADEFIQTLEPGVSRLVLSEYGMKYGISERCKVVGF